ncbi:ABC transporter substrate-binding protein, partial [Candidatus Poribacteria bacterium]|nr:ABC transporter substrate-binding protein [Candidatus Poribacteria bacterium]
PTTWWAGIPCLYRKTDEFSIDGDLGDRRDSVEREKYPRIRKLLLLCVFCGAFFCWLTVTAESALPPRFGGTLQGAIFQPVTTLDTVNYLNFAELHVASNLYEGLVKRDRFGRISPAITQDWTHSDDHRIWTFVIAQGMTFHNGKRVTATDVKLAWERFVRQSVWLVSPQPLLQIRGAEVCRSGTVTQIEGIRVLDDSRLQVMLRAGDPNFLEKLTSPAAWVTTPGDSQPIGTGQFRLESFGRTEVRLTANSDYLWGRPYLAELTFRYYANLDEALFEFESGVLDALPLPITEVERRQRKGLDDVLIRTDAATLVYLRLPDKIEISNPSPASPVPTWYNVLRYAVDPDALLRLQYGESPSKMVFVPSAFPYDRVKARRRMKHAGWRGTLNLVYTQLPDNTGNAIATWLKRDSLSQIGVRVEIKAADADNLRGEFSEDAPTLALLSMPIAPDSDVSALEIGRSNYFIPLYLLPSSFLCQPKVRGLEIGSGGILVFGGTWLAE